MSYLPLTSFFSALYKADEEKVTEFGRSMQKTELGLLPVGLKLHDLTGGGYIMRLVEQLGGRHDVLERNYYRRAGDSVCLVLPPVGSATSAIQFIECIELLIEKPVFRNPKIQIQVCSPGRLNNGDAGLLTLGFYIGSDIIRLYNLKDLETTFTESAFIPRGKRITIYDGLGDLDRNFEWWGNRHNRLHIKKQVPFKTQRTDVLTATTRKDVYNINLIATLLLHARVGGYWRPLGDRFRQDFINLLSDHGLMELLAAQWVIPDKEKTQSDHSYIEAIRKVRKYLSDEIRLRYAGMDNGILPSMRLLLESYQAELTARAESVRRGPT